jgi:hypothetical protein
VVCGEAGVEKVFDFGGLLLWDGERVHGLEEVEAGFPVL